MADLGTPNSPKCEIHDISLNGAEELTKIENMALAEAELEEEDISDDDDDAASLEVEKTMVDGKEYLIDRTTLYLYDIESHDEVGVWDEGSKTIKDINQDE